MAVAVPAGVKAFLLEEACLGMILSTKRVHVRGLVTIERRLPPSSNQAKKYRLIMKIIPFYIVLLGSMYLI